MSLKNSNDTIGIGWLPGSKSREMALLVQLTVNKNHCNSATHSHQCLRFTPDTCSPLYEYLILLCLAIIWNCKTALNLTYPYEWLWWSRGSALAFGTQVRGFKPGQRRRIFKGKKILSTPSFGREVKPSVPCCRFTACKRTLKCNVKVDILGKITGYFLAHKTFHLSLLGSLALCRMWKHLAAKVGTVRTT